MNDTLAHNHEHEQKLNLLSISWLFHVHFFFHLFSSVNNILFLLYIFIFNRRSFMSWITPHLTPVMKQ